MRNMDDVAENKKVIVPINEKYTLTIREAPGTVYLLSPFEESVAGYGTTSISQKRSINIRFRVVDLAALLCYIT